MNANFDLLDSITDFDPYYFVLYFGCIATNFILLAYFLSVRSRKRAKAFSFQILNNLLVCHYFDMKINSSLFFVSILLLILVYLGQITKNFISNNMKTSSVIVETRGLVSTIKELEASSRWICWLDEDETWINSKGSRAYEVAKSKDTGGCLFPTDFDDRAKVAMQKFHENGIIVTDCSSVYFMASTFAKFYPGYRYWRSNPIFETIQSHYMRRSLPKETKLQLNRLSLFLIEFGIERKAKGLEILLASKISNVRHESIVFSELERFIQANMKLVLLEIASFRTLFLLLFGSQFAIFLLVLFISTKRNRRDNVLFK